MSDELFCRRVDDAEFLLLEEFAEDSLPPAEHTVVAAWIEASPERRDQVAVTSALLRAGGRRSTQPKPRRRFLPLSLYAAAACIAGVVAVMALHPWRHSPVQLARLEPPAARAVAPEISSSPISGTDTVLLEAHRLRGSADPSVKPLTYAVSPDHNTTIQVMVPRDASAATYSALLASTSMPQTMKPVREDALSVTRTGRVAFVGFTVPPSTLAPGSYTLQLQSTAGSYSLAFTVVHKSDAAKTRLRLPVQTRHTR